MGLHPKSNSSNGRKYLIVSPEHGRNLESNNIVDANAFTGFDHSDANSRRIFNMMIGPGIDANLAMGSESNQIGDIVNTDAAITTGHILGIEQEMLNSGFLHSQSQSLIRKI